MAQPTALAARLHISTGFYLGFEIWGEAIIVNTDNILKDDRGAPIIDDTTKASILNNFFSECFNISVPPLSASEQSTISNVNPSDCPSGSSVQKKRYWIYLHH